MCGAFVSNAAYVRATASVITSLPPELESAAPKPGQNVVVIRNPGILRHNSKVVDVHLCPFKLRILVRHVAIASEFAPNPPKLFFHELRGKA